MSLTKLSLAGNNVIFPKESLVSDIPAGDGKIDNLYSAWIIFVKVYKIILVLYFLLMRQWFSNFLVGVSKKMLNTKI